MTEEEKNFRDILHKFSQGLDAGLKSLKEVREIYDEQIAFEFNSVNFFRPNENKISKILAFFLNPHATHGQKDKFLRVFLEKYIANDFLGVLESTKSAKISTEYLTNQKRRIDIVINLGSFMIGIENKIWKANDQKNQLQDYADFLEGKSNDNYTLFFLTSSGYEPSEYSIAKNELNTLIEQGKIIIISFKKDIIELFEQFEFACQADNVRAFIKDFKQYLKQKFLGEKIMGESDFIKNAIKDTPLILKYIDRIYNSCPSLEEELVKKFKDELVEELDSVECRNGTGKRFKIIPFQKPFESHMHGALIIRDNMSEAAEKCGFNIILERNLKRKTLYIGISIKGTEGEKDKEVFEKFLTFTKNTFDGKFKQVKDNPLWPGGYCIFHGKFIKNESLADYIDNSRRENKIKDLKIKIIEYMNSINVFYKKHIRTKVDSESISQL